MTVKINCILIPTINDHHVVEVARAVADLGVHRFNLMPLIPVAGTNFSHLFPPEDELVDRLRAECEEYLPQCAIVSVRADAAGVLGEDNSFSTMRLLKEASSMDHDPVSRPYVAVASLEGVFVNAHLGTRKNSSSTKKHPIILNWSTRPAPPGQGRRTLATIVRRGERLSRGGGRRSRL